MNYFDNEEHILDLLQSTSILDVLFLNHSLGLIGFYYSLKIKHFYKNWVNNSGKSKNPPDFYNDKTKTMMEVMRFDDYETGPNSPNTIESKKIKEINDERRNNGLNTFDNKSLKIIYLPNLNNASESSLDIQYNNFKRVFEKHTKHIGLYKENHPGYKLAFMLFDESAGYVERVLGKKIDYKPGDRAFGLFKYYRAIQDERVLSEILKADIDYLIWFSPFIQGDNRNGHLPKVFLLDVKKAKRHKVKTIKYKYENIVCVEAKEKMRIKESAK